MITKTIILENKVEIIESIQFYIDSSIKMTSELLLGCEKSWDDLNDEFRIRLPDRLQEGRLSNGWSYWLHGFQCQFNGPAGEILDVNISKFHNLFAFLDPYFYGKFMKTSNRYEEVASLITDEFDDSHFIFEVLREEIEKNIEIKPGESFA